MPTMLNDRELEKLINKCILNGSSSQLKGNSYELRLGSPVLFQTTQEELELPEGKYLEIGVGEAVTVASLETIDFRREIVQKLFPESLIMAFVTPTTTMMREGISDVSTIVDAGFTGSLNWLLKNNSSKSNKIRHGESLFKLTIFKLDKSEMPDKIYGERGNDFYFDKKGIVKSARQLEAQILEVDMVKSSEEKLDSKKRLEQAGGLWSYVGTELVELDGKLTEVHTSLAEIKKDFTERTSKLSKNISDEAGRLTTKISESEERVKTSFQHAIEAIWTKKSIGIRDWIVEAILVLISIISLLVLDIPYFIKYWISGIAITIAIIFLIILLRRKY